jgi:hypothetical protein
MTHDGVRFEVGADINTLSSRRRPGSINTIYTIIFNIVFMGPGLRRGDNEGRGTTPKRTPRCGTSWARCYYISASDENEIRKVGACPRQTC